MSLKLVTRFRKNGVEYRISAPQINDAITLAVAAANDAQASAALAGHLVHSTDLLVGGGQIPVFDERAIYNPFDLVMHDDKLYRCLVYHAEDTPWVSTNWFETSFYLELKDLRSGDRENVVLTVTTWDGQGTLEGLAVSITIMSSGQIISTTLDANGQCTFSIPKLETYSIEVEALSGYRPIGKSSYIATVNARNINLEFARLSDEQEIIDFYATAVTANGSVAPITDFVGQTVTCIIGQTEQTQILDAQAHCQFTVGYESEYTIVWPQVTGYRNIRYQESHTANLPRRVVVAEYRVIVEGIFAMDANRNCYNEDEVRAMSETDKAQLLYVVVNTPTLSAANAGFFFKVQPTTIDKAWSNSVNWNSSELLPFKGNANAAKIDYNGKANTDAIIAIGAAEGWTTPAASWARDENYVELGANETYEKINGFLPAAGQWQVIVDNWTALLGLTNAMGKSLPAFKSGVWWSSTQYYASSAWNLRTGGLSSDRKANGYTVIPFFAF